MIAYERIIDINIITVELWIDYAIVNVEREEKSIYLGVYKIW